MASLTDLNCFIRLGKTETLLQRGYLRQNLGVPTPQIALYEDGVTRVNRSDAGQSPRGQRKVTLQWGGPVALSVHQFWVLKRLVIDAIQTGGSIMWVTFDLSWEGESGFGSYVDGRGVAVLPTSRPIPNQKARRFEVTLEVNNITIINDPAINL